MSKDCATVVPTVQADGTLLLSPAACATAERERCVVLPSHPPHYADLARLLKSVSQWSTDHTPMPLVVVLSGTAALALPQFCHGYPELCDGRLFEATDLPRLVDLATQGQGRHGEASLRHRSQRAQRLAEHLADSSALHAKRADLDARERLRKQKQPSMALLEGFYVSAAKKLFGTAFARCKQAWVMDCESVAIRPFSFRRIFDDYWADPVVYFIGPDFTARQQFLAEQAFRRLGLPPLTSGSRWGDVSYRHNDYWHWDAGLMRAMMARVARVARGNRTFLDVFLESPIHEMAYYTYAQFAAAADGASTHAGRAHRFANASRRAHRFYRQQGYANGPPPDRPIRPNISAQGVPTLPRRICEAHPPNSPAQSLSQYLVTLPKPALACGMLAQFGYHAIRFTMKAYGEGPCYSGAHGTDLLRSLAQACSRNGTMRAGADGVEPAFEWLLSEHISFLSVDLIQWDAPNAKDARTSRPVPPRNLTCPRARFARLDGTPSVARQGDCRADYGYAWWRRSSEQPPPPSSQGRESCRLHVRQCANQSSARRGGVVRVRIAEARDSVASPAAPAASAAASAPAEGCTGCARTHYASIKVRTGCGGRRCGIPG